MMGRVLWPARRIWAWLRPGKTTDIPAFITWTMQLTASLLSFGIPELNKNTIQAQLKLSADEANAEAVKLLSDYVLQYIAPDA